MHTIHDIAFPSFIDASLVFSCSFATTLYHKSAGGAHFICCALLINNSFARGSNGKRNEEGVGWASQGITAEIANLQLAELKKSQRIGEGILTLKQKRLLAEQAKMEQEKQVNDAKIAKTSFKEVASQYLVWARSNKKSWVWDEQRIRLHIQPVIGNKAFNTIAPSDIEDVKNKCTEKGLASATVCQCLAVIRQVFNYAMKHDLFENGRNPVKSVKFPKINNSRIRFLSYAEADTLLSIANTYTFELHDMCLMSIYTGMRANEIFSLKWGDIDFENEIITIRD
jgi:hypothetical protein